MTSEVYIPQLTELARSSSISILSGLIFHRAIGLNNVYQKHMQCNRELGNNLKRVIAEEKLSGTVVPEGQECPSFCSVSSTLENKLVFV